MYRLWHGLSAIYDRGTVCYGSGVVSAVLGHVDLQQTLPLVSSWQCQTTRSLAASPVP